MSQVRYTEATTLTSKVTTELNSLADDASALISTELSNDASTERESYANFAVSIAAQGAARDAAGSVSLLIVPAGLNDEYTDAIAAVAIAQNYYARDRDGNAVTWVLDAATTTRDVSWAGVRLPNANYKIGLVNETGQALAASGNIIYMSGTYSETYA